MIGQLWRVWRRSKRRMAEVLRRRQHLIIRHVDSHPEGQQIARRQAKHAPDRAAQVCRTGKPRGMGRIGQIAAGCDGAHHGGHSPPQPIAAERKPKLGVEASCACTMTALISPGLRSMQDLPVLLSIAGSTVMGFERAVS